MKKWTSILLIAVLVIAMLTGCQTTNTDESSTSTNNSSDNSAETNEPTMAEQIFANVEPMGEETELIVGTLSGGPHGFTNHLIGKLGGYEYANLDADVVIFGNGPIMVEAMAAEACDVGIYGLGGVLAGTLGQGIINLGACARDFHGLMVFAPNDSPIVQAGQTLPDYPGVYGTAELWKGQEIFAPVGTTLYFTLVKGLGLFGLTPDDVAVTHMSPQNTNTALRAGQCEVGGLWGAFSYSDINEDFTPVIRAGDVGVNLVTNFVATEAALSDDAKSAAVKKWLELYYAAVEWMYESDENYEQALQWFVEWNEENGITSTRDEVDVMCTYSNAYTIEEAYEIATKPSELGDFSLLVEYSYDPMVFFVGLGNYEESDLEKFIQPEFWDTSFIEEIYEANQQ